MLGKSQSIKRDLLGSTSKADPPDLGTKEKDYNLENIFKSLPNKSPQDLKKNLKRTKIAK